MEIQKSIVTFLREPIEKKKKKKDGNKLTGKTSYSLVEVLQSLNSAIFG